MTLQLNKVTAGYTKVPVITDITFDVNPGEICGLIGLNGAGKSTTIKTIIGQLTPFSGRVEVEKLSILETNVATDNPLRLFQKVQFSMKN